MSDDDDNVTYELMADVRLPREVAYGGTLAGWQKAALAASKVENCPHFSLGLAGGFAGPILQLCGFETCGINLSGFSSGGKSLAQQLAVSSWSSPRLTSGGLFKSARTTENFVEFAARQSTGTVLGLDELAHIDGKALARLVYSLASGTGKGRMQPSMKPMPTITWSTFVLFSCEQSLEQKIRSEGGRWQAGITTRVADIDITGINKRVPREEIDAVEGIFYNFGHAGGAYIQEFLDRGLAEDTDGLRKAVLKTAGTLAGDGAESAHRRAAIPFALLLRGGILARDFGVLPAETNVEEAVRWGWRRFCGSTEAEALDPKAQALGNIRLWIAERWDSTCRHIGSAFHYLRTAEAWYDDDAVYIPRAAIAEAAGHVLSEQALVRIFVDGNHLAARHSDKRAAVQYIKGVGRVTVYALKRTEFGPEAAG